jgi:hypothetical protein
MSAMALPVWVVTVVALVAIAYIGVVAKSRSLFNRRSERWQVDVDQCVESLGPARAAYIDVPSRALQLTEYIHCTLLRREPLDRAVALIETGKRLLLESRLAHFPLPEWLKRRLPASRDPQHAYDSLQRKLQDLISARAQALEPVDAALRSHLPDLRERLGALPIQASTLGIGVLTLLGFIWLSGYYGVLGVAFMPLLNDVNDIALIGLTSGLMPLAAFASMVAASLIRIETARSAARSYANATRIARALITARDARRIKFWAWRAIPCFCLLFLISLAAAATLKLRLEYTLSFADSQQAAKAVLVGSIGDFVLIGERLSTTRASIGRIIAIPRERLRCMRSGGADGPELDACISNGEQQGAAPLPTQVTVINEDTVRHSWQAYVTREAECLVINPDDRVPLLSPVFRDGSGNDFDLAYYQVHPTTWPYPQTCAPSESEECAVRAMAGNVTQLMARIKADGAYEPSLHLFAFASDTHFPEHNRLLADARAKRIAELLRDHVRELKDCEIAASWQRPGRLRGGCPVSIHTHAVGQMPDFLWAGVQGDASKRVVMAAACKANVH